MDMFDQGVTVLFVSHSLEQVRRLCNKAMILDHGKLVAYGDIEEVADQYEAMLDDCSDLSKLPAAARKELEQRRKQKKEAEKKAAEKKAAEQKAAQEGDK